MKTLPDPPQDQKDIWNGASGQGWVDNQVLLDHIFQPLADVLVAAVQAAGAKQVLDVGCGTGATTLAIARHLGTEGDCLGVDLSEIMIQAARARAEQAAIPAQFICADAQTYAFPPALSDMIVSRFGVMFFPDPIQAFTNLRSAARRGAKLCCIAWRSVAENPFMGEAERAAAPFLPGLMRRATNGPGQFGLADKQLVHDILTQSGWQQMAIQPLDVRCAFPATELDQYLYRLGPLGRALQTVDPATRGQIIAAVRPAFEPYLHGAEVQFTAACWMIMAEA